MTTATRQSRKGEISSWKAYAPAFAGKVAIEAVDRAMRGEGSPSPIWEGEDGVIAWLLVRARARPTRCRCPAPGEPKRAILDTYTKEHSAEYQSQAPIDLARRMRERIGDLDQIATIVLHTSHHTHDVIGTGANDPQKFDPDASRETLDHSMHVHLRRRPAGRRPGTTNAPTPPSARTGPTRSSCGARSPPSRTRSGRAATTRPTRPRRPSAPGP